MKHPVTFDEVDELTQEDLDSGNYLIYILFVILSVIGLMCSYVLILSIDGTKRRGGMGATHSMKSFKGDDAMTYIGMIALLAVSLWGLCISSKVLSRL